MSRYLMVLWSGGGNVPPQLSVARQLLRRGHEVSVLAPRSLGGAVEAAGAAFEPYRRAPEHDAAHPELDPIKDWQVSGLAAAARVRDRLMLGTASSLAEDVLAVAADVLPDVLVTDYALLGGFLAAERAGLPVAGLVHSIFPLPRPGVPPFGFGAMPARGLFGRVRDGVLTWGTLRFYNTRLPDLNAVRASLGLASLGSVFELFAAADRLLVLTSPAFNFPGALPPNAVWVGVPSDSRPQPSSPRRSEPSAVLVSLSTSYQNQDQVLERLIQALAALPVRAVVTCGPATDPARLPSPSNVQVLRWAPHDELLPSTDLVVTHGGHGTVMAALRHGVPVVCLPMGRDQRDVAARVRWRGAGMVGRAQSPPHMLRKLIAAALGDDSLRRGAQNIARGTAADEPELASVQLEELARPALAEVASGPAAAGLARSPS